MSADEELRAQVREIVRRVLAEQNIRLAEQNIGLAEPSIGSAEQNNRPVEGTVRGGNSRTVALGADHSGLELKQHLAELLPQLAYAVTDCGTFTPDPVDYPDIAYAVAKLVSDGTVARGIIIDGAGIGSAMVANKVPGVRAALCYDATTARNGREHNDANVLTLGGRLIPVDTAREIVRIFLETECTEARHLKRVEKIMQVERRFLRK